MSTKKGPKKAKPEKTREPLEYDNRPALYATEDQVKFTTPPDLKQKVTLEVEAEVSSLSLLEYGDNKGKKEYRFRIDKIKLKE